MARAQVEKDGTGKSGSWLVVVALWLIAGAVAAAQFDLRRTEPFEQLRVSLAQALGLELTTGPVHLDLVTAQGLVIHNFEIQLGSFRLRVPRAVVRPTWSSLDGPELRPSIHAHGFDVYVDADNSAEAFLRLKELLELAHFPDAKLALTRGSVRLANGDEVMRGVRFRLDGTTSRPHLRARARTSRGGRIDLRGERNPDGALFVHAYPEGVPVADVSSWLDSAGVGMPERWEWPEVPVAVTGRWHIELGTHGSVAHDFDLAVEGNVVPIALDVTGEVRTENEKFVPGGQIEVVGRVGRLRGAQPAGASTDPASMLVSGPVRFELRPSGRVDAPELHGLVNLDDAHLRLSDTLRKVCGSPARLNFSSQPIGGVRVSNLGLELGALRVRAKKVGDDPLIAESEWVEAAELAELLPVLRGRAHAGRLRLASSEFRDWTELDGRVEFDGVALAGRRTPIRIDGIEGSADIGPNGFRARHLLGNISGVPVTASLNVEPGGDEARAKVRLDLHAAEIDLERLGMPLGAGSDGELSPESIVAAAEAPVTLLREQRARVDRVLVERARVRVDRLRSGSSQVRKLDLVLALRSLRLELKRARFAIGGETFQYAGMIDLNPLVPEVRIAAAP